MAYTACIRTADQQPTQPINENGEEETGGETDEAELGELPSQPGLSPTESTRTAQWSSAIVPASPPTSAKT